MRSLLLTVLLAASATASNKQGQDCLHKHLDDAKVPHLTPSSPNWANLSLPFNVRLQPHPLAIAQPETKKHVEDAVTAAVSCDVKIQAKGGGHSYASYSSGNGILSVDLQWFENVTVDDQSRAHVGGGVRLGNLDLALYNGSTKRALSHGTCPGVGIGGHATHGGYGYDSRLWGLALDAIVGMNVVIIKDGKGTLVETSSKDEPDLFWALRGAGDSFGIVTEFIMETQPAPEKVYNFVITIEGMYDDATKSADTFMRVQNLSLDPKVIDRNISYGTYGNGKVFLLRGKFIGSEEKFNNTVAKMVDAVHPTVATANLTTTDWIGGQVFWSGQDTIAEQQHPYPAHSDFYASSVVVPQDNPLTHEALRTYFDYMIKNGTGNLTHTWESIINLYGGPDSQINTASKQDASYAAYPDRESLWIAQHLGYPLDSTTTTNVSTLSPEAIPFVKGLNHAMTVAMPGTTFGAYANYQDSELSREDALQLYYGIYQNGPDTLTRLEDLKRKYDPKEFFWNPQSIPASTSASASDSDYES